MEAAEPSHWAFGWEALVAIGTLALAAATAGLARSTRTVAQATRDELSGQWRPVLLPVLCELQPVIPRNKMGVTEYGDPAPRMNPADAERWTLTLTIRNNGVGPAVSWFVIVEGENRGERPPLSVGEQSRLRVEVARENHWPVEVIYTDLGERLSATTANLYHPGGVGGSAGINQVHVEQRT